MRSLRSVPVLMAVGAVALFVAGCTSTAIKPLSVAPTPDDLARYAKIQVTTSAHGDASKMSLFDQQRIAALVRAKVKELAPNRFNNVAATSADPETLHVVIAFTRYDEGDALLAASSSWGSPIQIDAEVTLEDRTLHTVIGKFEVTMMYLPLGPFFGGLRDIYDVEAGFAKAVAKAVLGQS